MKIYSTTLIICSLLALFSCNNATKKKDTVTNIETISIIHGLGTDEVPQDPDRLVVLNFATLENLELINTNIVGIPKQAVPQYLSRFSEDDDIINVGSLVEVNLETINELQPDLIISGTRLSDSYPAFSKIAPTIYNNFDTKDPLGALKKDLDALGAIFKTEDVFDKAFADLETKIKFVKTKIANSNETALVVLHNKGRFSAYGSGSRFGLVHDILGVKEAAPGLDTHLHGTRASSEFIQKINPDILFIVDRSAAIGDQPLNTSDIENELIQHTKAFKNKKIIYLNSEAWYLSGTGGITSMNIMVDEVASAF
ncbi:siderophore ABC transporter substrate-binding protein [Gelidibacter maritimus]|uniref:ABC transporter substrate-binding protein n=1 Tax=Gelidibacter maritimus TaxID=2761487 RepID=A0A7W2M5J9_9FLAO|nr:ABC transporter substrate-binding protein [Gelidibacter maritimus]MBA6153127.1 ABC transporter substrate-binding protein [Gelidibacter maritimus]